MEYAVKGNHLLIDLDFVRCSERMPEKDGVYSAVTPNGYVSFSMMYTVKNGFNTSENNNEYQMEVYAWGKAICSDIGDKILEAMQDETISSDNSSAV